MKAIIKTTIHDVIKEEFAVKRDQEITRRNDAASAKDLTNVSKMVLTSTANSGTSWKLPEELTKSWE